MHEAAGNKDFIVQSLAHINTQIAVRSQELSLAIGCGIGTANAEAVEAARVRLSEQLERASVLLNSEPSHRDKHYVSRFDPVGLFQSALSKIFAELPGLQGYGNLNALWLITEIEKFAYEVKGLLERVHTDKTGNRQSAWAAIVCELIKLKTVDDRSPYPLGTPKTQALPEQCIMTLLADWGGDNDAAHKVASVVRRQKPNFCVHLGDIYYGGTKYECELFLDMWPMRVDMNDPKSSLLATGSYALNGNHEMYSGGEYYFNTVLPAFGQTHPFFCLENQYWRIVGLDTAYAAGRLKPQSPDDPINTQWNWLVQTLRGDKKKTIFLTHHQPVSAHLPEWNDSKQLRADVDELLALEGIGDDAIFGWFFGHEHRCALYKDSNLKYNPRLIGNGCIPHEVQSEKQADLGCTEVEFFNKKETSPGSNTAISSFAKLTFMGSKLLIEYVDETYETWGGEVWDSSRSRLDRDNKDLFTEYDGKDGRSAGS